MTDLPPDAAAPGAAGAQSQAPQLRVLAQYVRDSSFENPAAPMSLRGDLPAPQIQMAIDIAARNVDQDAEEISLHIKATAKRGEETVFIAELLYSGLFAFINIPEAERHAVTLIECPRLLFPFARQVLSDMTREGGFPPVLLEPLDFAALYRQRMLQQQQQNEQQGGAQPNGNGAGPNGDGGDGGDGRTA